MSNLSRREFLMVGFAGFCGLAGCTSNAGNGIVHLATVTEKPTSTVSPPPTSTRVVPTKTSTATATPSFNPSAKDLTANADNVAAIRIEVPNILYKHKEYVKCLEAVKDVIRKDILPSVPEDICIDVMKEHLTIWSGGFFMLELGAPITVVGAIRAGLGSDGVGVLFLAAKDDEKKFPFPIAINPTPIVKDEEGVAFVEPDSMMKAFISYPQVKHSVQCTSGGDGAPAAEGVPFCKELTKVHNPDDMDKAIYNWVYGDSIGKRIYDESLTIGATALAVLYQYGIHRRY